MFIHGGAFMRSWFCCILLTCLFLLAGCGSLLPAPAPPTLTQKEAKQTKEAADLTAQPSPLPTATSTPLPSVIVSALGNTLLNIDPVDRILETTFDVVDVFYGPDPSGTEIILRVTVNCDGLCSRERSFAVTMQAVRGNLGYLNGMIPSNLTQLHVVTLKNLQPTGTVIVRWQDVTDYSNGVITGTQLAARIIRP
jgi:hypothetical protein